MAWFGFRAPVKIPKDVIARLDSTTPEALAEPAVRTRLAELAQDIFPREQQTPEALASLQKPEIAKCRPVSRANKSRKSNGCRVFAAARIGPLKVSKRFLNFRAPGA